MAQPAAPPRHRRRRAAYAGRQTATEKRRLRRRINPFANKLLVLRGQLTCQQAAGAAGAVDGRQRLDRDLVGCSVEAVIRPPEGSAD